MIKENKTVAEAAHDKDQYHLCSLQLFSCYTPEIACCPTLVTMATGALRKIHYKSRTPSKRTEPIVEDVTMTKWQWSAPSLLITKLSLSHPGNNILLLLFKCDAHYRPGTISKRTYCWRCNNSEWQWSVPSQLMTVFLLLHPKNNTLSYFGCHGYRALNLVQDQRERNPLLKM